MRGCAALRVPYPWIVMVLVVPMVARSQMGGPWSRAKRVARAFRDGGHEVTIAWGDDGNCVDPGGPTLEIPVPSPLGLPDAIARHTFPLASRLGLMGRKPVHHHRRPRRGHPVRGQRLAADDHLLRLKPAQIRGNSTPAARDGNARPGLVPDDP